MAKIGTRSRSVRLLPNDSELGWTPYAWLVYLQFQYLALILQGASREDWAITIVAMAIFLPIYFKSYWVCGKASYAYSIAIAVIGAIVTPHNPWASAYFVYASAFTKAIEPPKRAWWMLAAYLAAIGLYAWLVHLDPGAWLTGIVFSALVGALCIHGAQTRRLNADLRIAHAEVERLAKIGERERIARDLHDVLGHTLSVIVLKSELASRLAERDMARAAVEIADVERIARESLAELREAIAGYRTFGLAAEVQRARGVLASAGVRVECDLGDVRVPSRYEGVLALAIREAVTNIVRHAGASTCRLLLAQTARECRFEIADDGRGGASVEGTGLVGMRERVEALGGTLVRDVAHGTRLTLRLPLSDAV